MVQSKEDKKNYWEVYFLKNKEKIKLKDKKYYLKNRLTILKKFSKKKFIKSEYDKLYNVTNKGKIKKYRNSLEYKKIKLKSDMKYYFSNKEKKHTHDLVFRDKKLRPYLYPNECCICGVTKNIHFHHPNYDFPLSVYPLCSKHHSEIHYASDEE